VNDLYKLLFEKERIGQVLELIKKEGIPDPNHEPERALVYAHALTRYADFHEARRIYEAVPFFPAYEAERLWGLANALLRLGEHEATKKLLDEALKLDPPSWLRLRMESTRASLFLSEGRIEEAHSLLEKAVAKSQSEPNLVLHWIIEGDRGSLLSHRGRHEEALSVLQRAVKQLCAMNAVTTAAHLLMNLGAVYESLGNDREFGRSLERAEPLLRESGSLSRLVILRINQGIYYGEVLGLLDQAEQCFGEALELLRQFPFPELEIFVLKGFARLRFRKGDFSEALRLVRKARDLSREKGFPLYLDGCLFNEAVFLLRSGDLREGLLTLKQAEKITRDQGKQVFDSQIALYFAYAFDRLGDSAQALQWLGRSFEAAERVKNIRVLLSEKEVLVPLLLKLGSGLVLTETVSRVLVQLRHPTLMKRLFRGTSQGKLFFLRSLTVQDSKHFRKELARLKNNPEKEVRHAARLLLQSWTQNTTYRVRTLGTLHVLLEGKLLDDRDWFRPVIKRLFLFFLTQPETWVERETILEAVWRKATPGESAGALKTAFSYLCKALESWHLPDMDYVFFKSQRGAYGFFPGNRFWMDYQEFERGIKKAEKDHRDRNFKEARKAYREALDLYLGDYLEEFPYEDWLRPKRDYLRELYFRGVMRYAALERDSGNLPEARRVLEEALFKDLSRCDCITLLIQTLAQMKLTQQAKDWGQKHIQYLKKELREKPAPEVKEALARL
jgi:tetratricopeptide (TPR) repeat protein